MMQMRRKTEDNKKSKPRIKLSHTSKSSSRLPRKKRKRKQLPRRRPILHQM